jgi:NADH-quinone oxidoreductase subunit J
MFATFLVLSALGVVLASNPIYSVLLLIFAFFNSAGLFILLKAEFLAAVLIIVYVGAVAVLFLFVVMLVAVSDINKRFKLSKTLIFSAILLLVLGVEIVFLLKVGLENFKPVLPASNISNNILSLYDFALVFFNNYYYLFILCSIILTIAMVGAVVLSAREEIKINKRQNVGEQNNRDKQNSVYTIKVDREEGI